MKNLFAITVFLFFILSSCSKNEETQPVITNTFNGTSWMANDDIASVLYGSGCTTTIEFISETKCQEIDYVPKGIFSGTKTYQGTYTFKEKTVTWTADGHTISGTVSGSILTSDMNTVAGGKRIYTKK